MRLFNGVYRLDRPSIANAMRIDLGCIPAVLRMNQTGMILDTTTLSTMDAVIEEQLAIALANLRREIGKPDFNPNSGLQVGRLLYDELGLIPTTGMRFTDSGAASTDDTALAGMQGLAPAIVGKAGDLVKGTPGTGILGVRQMGTLRSRYTGPLAMRRLLSPDSRMRTTLSLTTARTGRFNSYDPNMQNLPPYVRRAFVAKPGCVFVSHDLSQIEMVWTAELSQDRNMITIFVQGHDMHVKTACAIFKRDYDTYRALWVKYKDKKNPLGTEKNPTPEWTEARRFELEERLPSKTIGFAVVYGTTAAGLQGQIVMQGGPYLDIEIVEQYIKGWYGTYPVVRDWLDLQKARARRYGMVWSGFGRPRRIPESRSSIKRIASAGDRQTGNTPVQGTAGEHLKLALGQLFHEYIDSYWKPKGHCEIVLQIHDELITEVEASMATEYAEMTRDLLENCVPLSVPVRSSYSIANDWGGLK